MGYSTGMPIVIFLLAEPLRRLGKYTFSDVVCVNLEERPIRIFGAIASLVVVTIYLIAQMAGAGSLIHIIFGLDFHVASVIVGALMICYVLFGGMVATTWVQIVKACLMLASGATIALLCLSAFHFDFSAMLLKAQAAHPQGAAILGSVEAASSPFSTLSLGLALMFGSAGLPHILMRFFTVPDARAARTSVVWGNAFMSGFYALVSVLGFGAIALLANDPSAVAPGWSVIGGVNMAAGPLSLVVCGGWMLGSALCR